MCRVVDSNGRKLGGPVEGPRDGIRMWGPKLSLAIEERCISMGFEESLSTLWLPSIVFGFNAGKMCTDN